MKRYVEDWSKQFNIPAEFNQNGLNGKHLLPEIEINLYRIGQEALNNTYKYAKANNASVSLQRVDGTVSLIIEDDGIGFEPIKKAVMTGDDRGLGLVGMKERAELVGGEIKIESSPAVELQFMFVFRHNLMKKECNSISNTLSKIESQPKHFTLIGFLVLAA
jgi:signal transduction histidine kinase